MAIRVFIKRSVPEGKIEVLRENIDRLRNMTAGQTGYISGETMRRIDRAGELLVISKWKTEKDWRRWFESAERSMVQRKIDELLGTETVYEIYDFD